MMVLFWHSVTHIIHIEIYDSKEFLCLVRVKMPVIYKKNKQVWIDKRRYQNRKDFKISWIFYFEFDSKLSMLKEGRNFV